MKLKTLATISTVSALFIGANANAGLLIDVYAGAMLGVGSMSLFANDNDKTESAQSYGAMLGIDIPVIRAEIEYNYLNSQDTKLQVGMINAYLKMPTPVLKPYLGVGVGNIFDGEVTGTDIAVNKSTAYQAMLGLTFVPPVLPFNIDAEGRVLYAHDVFDYATVKPDVLHYDLRLKLRYVF